MAACYGNDANDVTAAYLYSLTFSRTQKKVTMHLGFFRFLWADCTRNQ